MSAIPADRGSIEDLVNEFKVAVQEAAYSDCSPLRDPGNHYKHMECDEAYKALMAEIERLRSALTAAGGRA